MDSCRSRPQSEHRHACVYELCSRSTFTDDVTDLVVYHLLMTITDRVEDISLQQWLALTPPELVKAHLDLSDETIAHLNKTKQFVVGPN